MTHMGTVGIIIYTENQDFQELVQFAESRFWTTLQPNPGLHRRNPNNGFSAGANKLLSRQLVLPARLSYSADVQEDRIDDQRELQPPVK